jgi:hypothetical protein
MGSWRSGMRIWVYTIESLVVGLPGVIAGLDLAI